MSKDKISDYSATANSNTDIGGINIDEGCAPSGINDAIRTLMKQLKDFQQGTNSDSFNGPVGSTTASTGAFTTLTTTGTINGLTVGKGAGAVSTNTAVGASALAANTTGDRNFAAGGSALAANTTGAQNAAAGYFALTTQTTGNYNAAFGAYALNSNTTASNNAAFGYTSLYSNTTGASNTSIGFGALFSNTTASNNTAVGYQAGYSVTTLGGQTMVGYQAGLNTTGVANTFYGNGAGYYVSSGAKNTIIGRYDGNQGGLDIRTASNYIVLSDGDGNPRGFWNSGGDFYLGTTNGTSWTTQTTGGNSLINLGYYYTRNPSQTSGRYLYQGMDSASNYVMYNAGGVGVYLTYGATSWAGSSDERLKDIIEPIENAAEKVSTLRSVIGKYKTDEEGTRRSFLIAQDVQAVLPEAVSTYKVDGEEDEYLGIAYTDVIPLLVAAIKELKAEFDAYKEAHP